MNTQLITSKNTSVNTTKVPYLFNHIDWKKMQKRWGAVQVFDYGCGRKIDHYLKFFQDKGIKYVGYDPYWGDGSLILKDLEIFQKMIQDYLGKSKHMPVILISNVLNVLPEWEQVQQIHNWLNNQTPAPCFIKVYSGKGDGIGRMSKTDCYQQNKPTWQYIQFQFETIKKDIITHQLYAQFIK